MLNNPRAMPKFRAAARSTRRCDAFFGNCSHSAAVQNESGWRHFAIALSSKIKFLFCVVVGPRLAANHASTGNLESTLSRVIG
jgi:hypothetical protein